VVQGGSRTAAPGRGTDSVPSRCPGPANRCSSDRFPTPPAWRPPPGSSRRTASPATRPRPLCCRGGAIGVEAGHRAGGAVNAS